MATPILLLKRTAIPGRVPTTANFTLGEIAVNDYDGKLFVRGNNGSDYVGTIGSGTFTGDVTGTMTGAGNAITALTLASSGVVAGTYAGHTINGKGLVTSAITLTTLAGYGITNAVNTSQLGVASGVATLDATGKLTTSQLPPSVVGALTYQGTWNASTNVPALASGTGTKGQYYKVSVSGTTTLDGLSSWNANDSAVFDGTTWDKIDGQSVEVVSVFGRTGVISAAVGDYAGIYLTGNQTITASGDATGSGTTSLALTLASTGVAAGTYQGITVNGKGLVTGATSLNYASLGSPAFTGTPTAPTATAGTNTTQLATTAFVQGAGFLTGNQNITISGDASGSGTTAIGLTLANINSTTGTFAGLTLNSKGLVTNAVALSTLAGYGITDALSTNSTLDFGTF